MRYAPGAQAGMETSTDGSTLFRTVMTTRILPLSGVDASTAYETERRGTLSWDRPGREARRRRARSRVRRRAMSPPSDCPYDTPEPGLDGSCRHRIGADRAGSSHFEAAGLYSLLSAPGTGYKSSLRRPFLPLPAVY